MSKIKTHIGLAIRRAVMGVAVGESVVVQTEGATQRSVSGAVKSAIRRYRKNCIFTHAENTLTITLVDDAPPPQRNQFAFETMKPGEVRRLALPESEHHKVRLAAHACAVKNGWRLSCNKLGHNEIAVTRVEAHTGGVDRPDAVGKRRHMYPFKDLQEVGASFFVPLTEEPNGSTLRVHAVYHGKRLGVAFRVNYSGDSMAPAERGHTITRVA